MSLTAIFESFEQQYIEAASEIKRDLRSFKSLKGGLQHYNSYIKQKNVKNEFKKFKKHLKMQNPMYV